jgi:hypothetical protein
MLINVVVRALVWVLPVFLYLKFSIFCGSTWPASFSRAWHNVE